ncbi:TonB-dependent outer membrane protein, SusC/RagA (plasmid) [Gemmatirosa kalamazoonensis]|uniref:TonB-dependent outer membrane protein, SusC/RagA n=1 Tax=Gemmatirosa kalamazoonensis TaxID=861299 RepID=W0RU67_9BACT|nr:TonB-dependent receptor [Gemmatirosa kalamazoonensis]AHG93133.1 TonB-dependent outer membrane protein, SusC/RagA [Gemmatirosa kalamazoonensis]
MKRWLIACGLAGLSLFSTSSLRAQGTTGRVTGVVTSKESGQPIQGASVAIVGTRFGALTNDQGRYTVSLVPGLYKVRVTLIGYGPVLMDSVPVTAGQTTTANFELTKQALQLTAVTVVGYGTQAKRDVTGAIASVKAEEIKQTPTTNAIEAIKGKVPGVDIVTTGYKPGDGVRVRIRGQRSILASNDPLYVLDGVPMAGGIGDLNPADIESIEVLKDASATAIYGSRGANGVVLITSTKGNAGKTKISYDTYYGAEDAAKKVRVFNGPEFAEYKREAYRASGDYAKWCGTAMQCDEGDKNMFYVEEYNAFKAGISTDWQDLILRTGGQASHQLSITGGNDRTQYAVSGNMVRDNGIVLGQNFDRKSMRVNLETQANSRLRFGGSALVLRSKQNVGRGDGLYGETLADAPLSVPYDSAGNVIFKPTPDSQRDNPLSDVVNYINRTFRTRAFGTMFGEAKLAEGLNFRVNFGPDMTFAKQGTFIGAQTQQNQGSGANASIGEDRVFDWTLDNILTYKRELGQNHRIDATLLYSIERNTTESMDEGVSGLPYESQLFYNLGSAAAVSNIGSGISQWSLQSYMGRVNYTFMDKYLLTLTARIDGSSRLAEGRKYATFPSVALGYRAVDRNPVGPISSLKLRASYGITGNTSVNPYQTQGGLTRTVYSWGNTGAFGYRPGSLQNLDLGWEKTAQYDAGADFGLFNDRLTGTLDGYIANTTDLLMNRQLPPSTGYSSITQNIGATRNTGVEVALSHRTLDNWHGVRWTNDVTFSVARNKIVSLTYGKVDDPGNRWFIGQPINGGSNNVWYDYKMLGIWQLADSLEAKKYGEKPGEIRVQDVDGDGKINTNDLQILGNTFPKWNGSFNSRVDWKSFDLSAQVVTRQGFMVQNTFRTSNSTLAGRYNGIWVNYWTPTNPGGTDPRPNKNQENPTYGGVRAYEDGSFTRLRNVTLGFTLPKNLSQRFGSDRTRIYGTAQNPITWTNFTGLDPEGRTSAGTPSYKMFLLGATFGF